MHATTVVDLPDGDLIDCHDFARAVARFRYPVPEDGATGMACITATKMVDFGVRARPGPRQLDLPRKAHLPELDLSEPELDFSAEQFDPAAHAIPCPPLIAEAQLTLPVPGMMSELSFPVALTEENRALLEVLLNVLPPLKHPLSREGRELFLAAFRKKMESLQLVGAQCWEPILVPDRDEPEMMALGERFAHGLVDIVDQAGRHVETFDIRLGRGHYFLRRLVAIDVLKQVGLPHGDHAANSHAAHDELPDELCSIEPSASSSRKHAAKNEDVTSSARSGANCRIVADPPLSESVGKQENGKRKVGERRLTDEQRVALVKRRNKLKADGHHAYAAETAREFGVSERTVSKYVKKAEPVEAAARKEAEEDGHASPHRWPFLHGTSE